MPEFAPSYAASIGWRLAPVDQLSGERLDVKASSSSSSVSRLA
jgi:hypothetical protein